MFYKHIVTLGRVWDLGFGFESYPYVERESVDEVAPLSYVEVYRPLEVVATGRLSHNPISPVGVAPRR